MLIGRDEFPGEITEVDEEIAREELQRVCNLDPDELSMERGLPFSMGRTLVAATWFHTAVVGRELDTYFEDDNSPVPRRYFQKVVDDEKVLVWPQRGFGFVQVTIGDRRLSATLPINGRGFSVGLFWAVIGDHSGPSAEIWMDSNDNIRDFVLPTQKIASVILTALAQDD